MVLFVYLFPYVIFSIFSRFVRFKIVFSGRVICIKGPSYSLCSQLAPCVLPGRLAPLLSEGHSWVPAPLLLPSKSPASPNPSQLCVWLCGPPTNPACHLRHGKEASKRRAPVSLPGSPPVFVGPGLSFSLHSRSVFPSHLPALGTSGPTLDAGITTLCRLLKSVHNCTRSNHPQYLYFISFTEVLPLWSDPPDTVGGPKTHRQIPGPGVDT